MTPIGASQRRGKRCSFVGLRVALPPWTHDSILAHYKFTNAYRASDRVSQYLIRNVIYEGSQSSEDVFFRTLLFKIFNKIETWELLKAATGDIEYSSYSFDAYDNVLTQALAAGRSIYSAAYIMPSAGRRLWVYAKAPQSPQADRGDDGG